MKNKKLKTALLVFSLVSLFAVASFAQASFFSDTAGLFTKFAGQIKKISIDLGKIFAKDGDSSCVPMSSCREITRFGLVEYCNSPQRGAICTSTTTTSFQTTTTTSPFIPTTTFSAPTTTAPFTPTTTFFDSKSSTCVQRSSCLQSLSSYCVWPHGSLCSEQFGTTTSTTTTTTVVTPTTATTLPTTTTQVLNTTATPTTTTTTLPPTTITLAPPVQVSAQAYQCQAGGPPVKFLEQILPPGQMTAGQSANVSITVANCGSSTWQKVTHFLGSRLPAGSSMWGRSRVDLPADVAANEKIKIDFTITAPAATATYTYQWAVTNAGEGIQPYSPPAIVGVGTVESCPEADSVKNTGTDASAVLQACVDRTVAGKTLELPAGVYTLVNQVKINRAITLRTAGTAGNKTTCLMAGAPACATFKAASNFPVNRVLWGDAFGLLRIAGVAGTSVDHLNNVALDHIVLDGNRQNRLGYGTSCDGNDMHFCPNIGLFANNSSVFYSASVNALLGTAFGLDGQNNVFAYNYIANNGSHVIDGQNPHPWADGLTASDARGATIMYNTFKDNTDVDLIVANGAGANVQFNTITHENTRTYAWAALMLNAFSSNALTDFTGADVSYNTVDCSYRCGFGIMIGGHSWNSQEPLLRGGSVHHNSITRARQGVNIDGAGTVASPLIFGYNQITNSGGYTTGCGWNSGVFNLSSDSTVIVQGSLSADSNRTWHNCTFNMDQTALQPQSATVVIRARGTIVQNQYPIMELRQGNTVLDRWTVTESFRDYTHTTQNLGSTNLRVYFVNDYFDGREDRNLIVDYISVNGRIYQSEDAYEQGYWSPATGCASGRFGSETIYCENGYFEYSTSQSSFSGSYLLGQIFKPIWRFLKPE